jgi:peptidoglycan/LPS O-acetylase OafA/YrhL
VAGVTIFFVLSGFLITSLIRRARERGQWSLVQFFGDRAARLFPALLLMELMITVWWLAAGRAFGQLVGHLAAATFYVEDFLHQADATILAHTWSLATEEQFYLLWPLTLPFLLRAKRPLAWVGMLVVGSWAARLGLSAAGYLDFSYANIVSNAYALLLGCGLAIWRPTMPRGQLQRLVPLGALVVIGLLVAAGWRIPNPYINVPIAVSVLAVIAVAYSLPGVPLLEIGPLRFFGRISYALYLWHWPLLFLTDQVYGRVEAIPMLLLSFALATASTFYVEEPIRQAWRQRRRAPEPVTPPIAP